MSGFGDEITRHIALVYGAFMGFAVLIVFALGFAAGAVLT
jgi:tetrahydromethanopterin S-methyltransferase subunit G